MGNVGTRGWRRPTVVGALAALGVVAIASVAVAQGPATSTARGVGESTCAHATDPAGQVSLGALRKTITCLINEERTERGKAALVKQRLLQRAAKRHTKTMVRTDCLAHQCGGEADFDARIRATGYLSGAADFDYAEDVGCEFTPQAMLDRWFRSKLHKRNILGERFHDIGVGASHGNASNRCIEGNSTFTVIFGFHSG